MSTDLRDHIQQGDLHFLDGLRPAGTIASQRWFGGKSRGRAGMRESSTRASCRASPRSLAFAIVEVRYGLQSHDLYHLPLGFRPDCGQLERASIIAATRRVDGLRRARGSRPGPRESSTWSPTTATLDIGEATLLFRSTGDSGTASATVPRSGRWVRSSRIARDVIDERLALKVYRRIEAGDESGARDPSLPHRTRVRAHRSARGLHLLRGGGPSRRRSRSCSSSSPPRGTGGALALGHARFAIRGGSPRIPAGSARSRRTSTTLSPPIPVDPHFAPEEPSTEALALISASIDEEIEQVLLRPCRTSPQFAPVRGRGEEVPRPAALAHAHRQRGQGHPPSRRLPPRAGALDDGRGLADPRLRGRAGPLGAGPAAQALATA